MAADTWDPLSLIEQVQHWQGILDVRKGNIDRVDDKGLVFNAKAE